MKKNNRCNERKRKARAKSNDQGRAYEYAWMQTLYDTIRALRKTRIVENSSLVTNKKVMVDYGR